MDLHRNRCLDRQTEDERGERGEMPTISRAERVRRRERALARSPDGPIQSRAFRSTRQQSRRGCTDACVQPSCTQFFSRGGRASAAGWRILARARELTVGNRAGDRPGRRARGSARHRRRACGWCGHPILNVEEYSTWRARSTRGSSAGPLTATRRSSPLSSVFPLSFDYDYHTQTLFPLSFD